MIFNRIRFQGLNERWPLVSRNLTALTRNKNGFPDECRSLEKSTCETGALVIAVRSESKEENDTNRWLTVEKPTA